MSKLQVKVITAEKTRYFKDLIKAMPYLYHLAWEKKKYTINMRKMAVTK